MALTLETALRDDLANQIDDTINTGSGTATLVFETSGDVEVATIDLQNPAFGASSTGTITLAGTPLSDTNATGGTIAQFSLEDRDGTKQLEGTVTVTSGGGDIEITSLVIAASETVTLSSFTLTVPAS